MGRCWDKIWNGMKHIRLIVLLTLSFLLQSTSGQTLEYAKKLIEQKQYSEAAKQLRPLADTGNSEAQYLIAELFFEGKGVAKNSSQGIRYATLSADQRNENGILLLVNNLERLDAYKFIQTIKRYLKPVEYSGDINDKLKCSFGYALVRGYGIQKDEIKGWEMIKSSAWHLVFLEENNIIGDYFQYRALKDGYDDLELYCDRLYGLEDDDCSFLLEYLIKKQGFDIEKDKQQIYDHYLKRANDGNAFSMAIISVLELEKNTENAENWARKSKNKGSGFGKWIWKNALHY